MVIRPGGRKSWRAEILLVLSRRDGKSLRGSLAKACHKPRLLALVLTTNPLHSLGGPWTRDVWGLYADHQWLANRGYAVLSVNYRGSTGFGKAFVNAANREWAGRMHDDLIDAVDWAIEQRIADPGRVAATRGRWDRMNCARLGMRR